MLCFNRGIITNGQFLGCAIAAFSKPYVLDLTSRGMGYYAVYCGNSLPKFRDNLSAPSARDKNPIFSLPLGFLALEDGTDKLSRNVRKDLPQYAA